VSNPSDVPGPPQGVIHDIGYRPYDGPRLGELSVAWSLFVTGLRSCYGLGRSTRSKVLPVMLFLVMLLPALILVAVMVQTKVDQQLLPYSRYAMVTQVVISVFVASQAPALISGDLRFRTITLYLARPLRRSTYVLVRVASLTAAVFVLVLAPIVLLYVGGLLADLPIGRETGDFAPAVVAALLLAMVLAGLSALVCAVTPKRGIAVAAVIVVLLVSYSVVATMQAVAVEGRSSTLAQLVGLFSPFTLVDGVQAWLSDGQASTPAPPDGPGMGILFCVVSLVVVAGSVGAMMLRYRKAAVA
jgi:ABC-2 type transport system permease protein